MVGAVFAPITAQQISKMEATVIQTQRLNFPLSTLNSPHDTPFIYCAAMSNTVQ